MNERIEFSPGVAAEFRKAVQEVEREVAYAEDLHGTLPNIDRAMVIMVEEVGEAAEEILEVGRMERAKERHAANHHRAAAMKELAQVAAVAMRLMAKLRGEIEE